jgi:hypothetical protein
VCACVCTRVRNNGGCCVPCVCMARLAWACDSCSGAPHVLQRLKVRHAAQCGHTAQPSARPAANAIRLCAKLEQETTLCPTGPAISRHHTTRHSWFDPTISHSSTQNDAKRTLPSFRACIATTQGTRRARVSSHGMLSRACTVLCLHGLRAWAAQEPRTDEGTIACGRHSTNTACMSERCSHHERIHARTTHTHPHTHHIHQEPWRSQHHHRAPSPCVRQLRPACCPRAPARQCHPGTS